MFGQKGAIRVDPEWLTIRRGAIWNAFGGNQPGPGCKGHPRLFAQGVYV
jgi:hypothetical protein